MDARRTLFWLGGSPWRQRLRRLGFVAVTVAAAVNFGLFAPAYRYFRLEGLRLADFDLWVNGPMTASVASAVADLDNVAASAAIVDITPRYLEAGGQRAIVRDGRFADLPGQLALLYPDRLLLVGRPVARLAPGEVALDSRTIDALGVRIGDPVTANFMRADGSEINLVLTVQSEYSSTGHLDQSVGGIADAAILSTLPEGATRYSSVYISTELPAQVRESIEAQYGPDLQVISRDELLRQGAATVGQTVDAGRELLFYGLALIILLTLVVRDLGASVDARSRSAAILMAQGVRAASISTAILTEQFLLLAAALGLGSLGGWCETRLVNA